LAAIETSIEDSHVLRAATIAVIAANWRWCRIRQRPAETDARRREFSRANDGPAKPRRDEARAGVRSRRNHRFFLRIPAKVIRKGSLFVNPTRLIEEISAAPKKTKKLMRRSSKNAVFLTMTKLKRAGDNNQVAVPAAVLRNRKIQAIATASSHRATARLIDELSPVNFAAAARNKQEEKRRGKEGRG